MLAWVQLLAPIVLGILNLFFSPKDARAAAIDDLMDRLSKIRAAIKESQDTGGDTSAIEDQINHK